MSTNTDVSGITDLPSMEVPEDLCEEGEHVFALDRNRYRYCTNCGRSLQAIVDWWGHDTGRKP